MSELLELLKIYSTISEKLYKTPDYIDDYIEEYPHYQKNFLKLKTYFQIYKDNSDWIDPILDLWINPILKINDLKESFKTVRDNYNNHLKSRAIAMTMKSKSFNFEVSSAWTQMISQIKTDIWELIESDIYDIKVEILCKEPKKEVQDEYEQAISLYWDGHFEKAFQAARDVFQKYLETKLQTDIKYFESQSDELSQSINQLLTAVSKIRNDFAKTQNFDSITKDRQKAITKFTIEQLIIIRGYLEIIENEEK